MRIVRPTVERILELFAICKLRCVKLQDCKFTNHRPISKWARDLSIDKWRSASCKLRKVLECSQHCHALDEIAR